MSQKYPSRARIRVLALFAAASLIFAGCSGSQGTDQAACVGPGLEVSPKRVAPGDTFALEGSGFFSGCEDVIIDGEPVDEEQPKQDVEIVLRQGSRTWELGTVDASEDYSIATKLEIPESVKPGKATVTADSAEAAIRVSGG